MNGTLKLKWLKSFTTQYEHFWFYLPSKTFMDVGGIAFLLTCDFEISKLPIKLSKFHQQVLHYWKLIYKHNFSPHNTPIWNNRYILIKKKSLYFKEWKENGIWSVQHLMDGRGNILDFNDFSHKYNIECSRNDYWAVIKAIPQALICMIKGTLMYIPITPKLLTLSINNQPLLEKKCNNKFLRSTLTKEFFPFSLKRKHMLKEYSTLDAKRIRCKFLSFPISPKAKEVHFKTINDIYPCGEFLRLKFNLDCNECSFVKQK